MPRLDETIALLLDGYSWLPDRRRRTGGAVHTRLMGQPTVGLSGPEAARFFYDEKHIHRRTALPDPVKDTLFGRGSVHALDGEHHRRRKALFVSLLLDNGVADLVGSVTGAWDDAAVGWARQRRIALFDEASRVIARGVTRWTGVPVDDAEVPALAADLVAMVDGFATLGPRHWRARQARERREGWLASLTSDVRHGAAVPPESAVAAVAHHREPNGELLSPKVAAVELLNIIRPTVAVCWFVSFAAHALHRWPRHRQPVRDDAAFAAAFVHEVRRFYPFAPFVGGRAVRDLVFQEERIPGRALVLLDLYGHNHDATLWEDPYAFRPERFVDRQTGEFDLVPQGGGDPRTGHRCPGEQITVALLTALCQRLAALDYAVPAQDLTISLRRIPARIRSGMVLQVHP
jgi:fatty-acid peroxygenase